ncbi:MAG: hypothetical protein V3T05_06075, partial [Myxococcota bacterium]
IVFTVVYSLVSYLAISIGASIASDLYGKPPEAHSGPLTVRERNKCISKVVGLRKELEGQVALELGHPLRSETPFGRWNLWFAGWTDKLNAARAGCVGTGNEPLDGAYAGLEEMHVGYTQAVERFIRTRSETAARLNASVQQLRQQP